MMMLRIAMFSVTMLRTCIVRVAAVRDPPTRPMHFQDYFDEHREHLDLTYNPSSGYEPYWVDGDWVFMDRNITVLPGQTPPTTTETPVMCDDECPPRYREIKHVCGRNVGDLWYYGCDPITWGIWYILGLGQECRGQRIDGLAHFRTFDTYCDFLAEQCKAQFSYSWIYVHRGKCDDMWLYVRDIREPWMLQSRVSFFFTQLSNRRSRRGLDPTTSIAP